MRAAAPGEGCPLWPWPALATTSPRDGHAASGCGWQAGARGEALDQRVEDRIIASSAGEPAPEHRFELVLRREFDRSLAVTRLVVRGPGGQSFELTDPRQLEILMVLSERALPVLREAEDSVPLEWERWREALALPGGDSVRARSE